MSLGRVGRMGINSSQQKSRTVQQASGLPGPPQNVVATVTGASTASVTWTAPSISGESPISQYTVESTPAGGSSVITGTSAAVSGLVAGTSYTFKVTPQNSIGRGSSKNSQSVTTPTFNEATGGTITTFSSGGLNYRRHTFVNTGSFVVTSASNPFTVFAVGGGGGGGGGGTADVGYPGASGGSGGAFNKTSVTIPVGTVTATIGNGGTGSFWYQRGGMGGNSSLGTYLTCGGGGGGSFYSGGTAWNGSPQGGAAGSEGGTSNGGTGGGGGTANTAPAPAVLTAKGLSTSIGAGGGGSGQGGGQAGSGQKGIVVIDYQIA